MNKQPDLSKIFDKHVAMSDKCRVSGLENIWVCWPDGIWRNHSDMHYEAKRALQKTCMEHGEQVGNVQWDFTAEEFAKYVEPILNGREREKQLIAELGYGG